MNLRDPAFRLPYDGDKHASFQAAATADVDVIKHLAGQSDTKVRLSSGILTKQGKASKKFRGVPAVIPILWEKRRGLFHDLFIYG